MEAGGSSGRAFRRVFSRVFRKVVRKDFKRVKRPCSCGFWSIKFGALNEEQRSVLRAADPEKLICWGERLFTAQSLDDVFGQ